jgi:hypothetical protein
MNSAETQQPSPLDLGFNLLAGALAGFVMAVEVSLLDLLIWGIGSAATTDFEEIAWFSPESAAMLVLCLLAAGVIGGLLSTILSRLAPATRQLATQSAFSLWVLGSFVYAVFGGIRVSLLVPLVVIDALLAFALAIATYFVWRKLLRWLRQGYVWRVVMAVAAMGTGLWIPLAVYVASS